MSGAELHRPRRRRTDRPVFMRESLHPAPMLAGGTGDDGISWVRVVTAIVLLALSLAIGTRTARDPPRPGAMPQPVREGVIAGVELLPLAAAVVDVPASSDASPTAGLRTSRAARLRAGEGRQIGRAGNRATASQPVRPRLHHVALAGRLPRPIRQSGRTRAQVRAEYLRSREAVAALTGEDSGSAYLMRVAARERAARPAGAGHRRR